jgi:hypothetical protein
VANNVDYMLGYITVLTPTGADTIHKINESSMVLQWTEHVVNGSGSLNLQCVLTLVTGYVSLHNTKQHPVLSNDNASVIQLAFAHIHCVTHPHQPRWEPLRRDMHLTDPFPSLHL